MRALAALALAFTACAHAPCLRTFVREPLVIGVGAEVGSDWWNALEEGAARWNAKRERVQLVTIPEAERLEASSRLILPDRGGARELCHEASVDVTGCTSRTVEASCETSTAVIAIDVSTRVTSRVRVAAHEFGHALGYEHVADRDSVMFGISYPGDFHMED